jgi:pyruvate dehydrogenase E1 component beta subunit
MLYEALDAAQQAAEQGIDCEVIDLRTLWPLDIETIVAVGEEDRPRRGGARGAEELRPRREIVSLINEKAFLHLEAPPKRVTGFDTPFPYTLENEYLPLAHRILPALVETARY